ncbi:MAG: hypothetical protein CVU71_00670 [Deltaproteobacteria bacterium HGW-Deltaproteobacteria-6]|nr:MAG: hypothetical protein CVU71_00670 [Deltaproteobacteria bacterium HGW-Deltaproteobacteria-6]
MAAGSIPARPTRIKGSRKGTFFLISLISTEISEPTFCQSAINIKLTNNIFSSYTLCTKKIVPQQIVPEGK